MFQQLQTQLCVSNSFWNDLRTQVAPYIWHGSIQITPVMRGILLQQIASVRWRHIKLRLSLC